ncbi:MAG: hypothetical protein IH788_03140, partial [Nitrospinae bacterium]|nr:hypothetical protein [Nitrospinota bacterium]
MTTPEEILHALAAPIESAAENDAILAAWRGAEAHVTARLQALKASSTPANMLRPMEALASAFAGFDTLSLEERRERVAEARRFLGALNESLAPEPAAGGHIAYSLPDGRVYRVEAREGATPEDISARLESFSPGSPDDPVQYIDARDLARFIVRTIEKGTTGTFNAVGPSTPTNIGELIYGCKAVSGGDARFTWV